MVKNTILHNTTAYFDGTVSAVFDLAIVEDGAYVVDPRKHRITFPPGDDIDARLVANNQGILDMGYPAISASDVAMIRNIVALPPCRAA